MRILKPNKKYLFIGSIFFILFCYYFYPEPSLPSSIQIDRIEVDKSEHRMSVFSKGELIKNYHVSLGRGVYGIHEKGWDNITPTGTFFIDTKFTESSFHKALTISYGNQVEIHGAKNGLGFIGKFHRLIDWTRGCIAVTNTEVDELYKAIPAGTPITIQE